MYLAQDEHSGVRHLSVGTSMRSWSYALSETICFEEDPLSERPGGCSAGYAGSRGV